LLLSYLPMASFYGSVWKITHVGMPLLGECGSEEYERCFYY